MLERGSRICHSLAQLDIGFDRLDKILRLALDDEYRGLLSTLLGVFEDDKVGARFP